MENDAVAEDVDKDNNEDEIYFEEEIIQRQKKDHQKRWREWSEKYNR